MRRWFGPAVLVLSLSILALGAPAAHAADETPRSDAQPVLGTVAPGTYATIAWPLGPVVAGEPARVTVTGLALTGPAHVYLIDEDVDSRPVLATGEITPASPTVELALQTGRLGTRTYSVLVEGNDTPQDLVTDDRASISVVAKPSTITAGIPSGTYRADAKAPAVTGVVSGIPGRLVQVQARAGNGTWVTLDQARSAQDGTFRIPTPTWWVGSQTLRAYAPPTRIDTEAASSDLGRVDVVRTYRPRGGTAWEGLFSHQARWNPCQPITYRVNPHRLPEHGLAEIAAAFEAISQATGLRFTYAGSTSFLPMKRGQAWDAHPDNADFVVAWSTPQVVPGLAGRTIGRGGAMAYRTGTVGAWELDKGQVVLDATQPLRGTPAAVKRLRMGLLLHELAHAIGLTHVDDKRQIMYPTLRDVVPQFGAGDLRGLAAVGASKGCFSASVRTR